MKLETALEIIKEQTSYVLSKCNWLDGKPVEEAIKQLNLEENGDNVSEYCDVRDSTISMWNIDRSRLYVSQVDSFGGEGNGDSYWFVFKINHPEHGEALVRYSGHYESWNGANWWGCEPEFVEAYEYTKVGYRPIKGE